jgi:uncharacterized protein YbjT (DUF2867 family)
MAIHRQSKRTYVVTAATGRIGNRVARGLLAAGHDVRAVGRDPARLAPLAALGAEPRVGMIEDRAFIERCFAGADAAFLVVSADHMARDFRRAFADIGHNFARAAETCGLGSALFISTIGTHDDRYRGFIMTHGDVEHILDGAKGVNMLHLRAPAFFENLFYYLPGTLARGALATPIDPDAAFDMASTADIATVALGHLLALDFAGSSALEIHGREVLTMRRIAELISQELGRPFGVEHIDRDTDIEEMVAAGMHRDFSTLMNDTWTTFSRFGMLRAPEPQRWESAVTPMEHFLRDSFVPALKTELAA